MLRVLVLLALAVGVAACGERGEVPAVPLAIQDGDLVRTGSNPTPVLRGIGWEAARCSADVRYPVAVIAPSGDRPGAIVVVENRRQAVVPYRVRGGDGGLEYATALEAPPRVHVEVDPAGGALLLVSEEDGYLPESSGFRLNRGVLYVRLDDLEWQSSIDGALDQVRRDDRWYTRPDERYVPEGPIKAELLGWCGGECRVRITRVGGKPHLLALP